MALPELLQWAACFHCGPINQSIHVALLAVFLFSLAMGHFRGDGMQWAGFAFLISFIGAKVATIAGSIFILPIFLVFAMFAVLQWRHRWAGKLIAALYAIRALWGAVVMALGLSDDIFWIVNTELLLTAQILLCFAGGIHGGNTIRDRKGRDRAFTGIRYGRVLARTGDNPRHPPRAG